MDWDWGWIAVIWYEVMRDDAMNEEKWNQSQEEAERKEGGNGCQGGHILCSSQVESQIGENQGGGGKNEGG